MLPLGRFPVLRASGYEAAYASIRGRHPGVHAFTPRGELGAWSITANYLNLGRGMVVASECSALEIGQREDGLLRVYMPLDKYCEFFGSGRPRRLVAGSAGLAPVGEFGCDFGGGFRGVIGAFPQSALAVILQSFDDRPGLSSRIMDQRWRESASLDGFRRQAFGLVRAFDDAPERLLDDRRFRSAHEELLMLHLAQSLVDATDDPVRPGAAYLARALDFIHAHLLDEIGPVAVAQAAGCSLRNLQVLFRREYGQTITEIVRRLRLQAARARLLRADERDTITLVALDCGFYHLSDFARLYRREFGELPSQTLAKARASAPW